MFHDAGEGNLIRRELLAGGRGSIQLHTHAGLRQIHCGQTDEQRERGDDLEIDDGLEGESPDRFQITRVAGDTHDKRAENQRHDDALDEVQENVREKGQ